MTNQDYDFQEIMYQLASHDIAKACNKPSFTWGKDLNGNPVVEMRISFDSYDDFPDNFVGWENLIFDCVFEHIATEQSAWGYEAVYQHMNTDEEE